MDDSLFIEKQRPAESQSLSATTQSHATRSKCCCGNFSSGSLTLRQIYVNFVVVVLLVNSCLHWTPAESCSPTRSPPLYNESEMETMSSLSNNDTWFVQIDNGNHTVEVTSTHRKPCTEEETRERDCHNGGTCFSIMLNENTRTLLCKCTKKFMGEQCTLRNYDPPSWELIQGGTTMIILICVATAAGVLAIVTGIVIAIAVYQKRSGQFRLGDSTSLQYGC